MPSILVTGATGSVGMHVVRELRERGVTARAFVRDPIKARRLLGDDVPLDVGDFADGASLRRAMTGVTRVFLSSADGPEKVAHELAVIDAAEACNIRLLVKASMLGASISSPLPPFAWHGAIEQQLRMARVPSVILRSNFYMTNLLVSAESVRLSGRLIAPAAEGLIAMIDPRDVAAIAARVLTEDGHEGRTYVLTGPEALSHAQIARALSSATGTRIAFVDVPAQAAQQLMTEAKMPQWLVEHLNGLFDLVRQGALAEITDSVAMPIEWKPRTFAQFARDHAALFRSASSPVSAHAS